MSNIIKRDGSSEPRDISKIRKQTIDATKNLNNVSYESLEIDANVSMTDNMKSSDIQTTLIKAAKAKVDIDAPDWTFVAARLTLYDLYHNIRHTYGMRDMKAYNDIGMREYLIHNESTLSYYGKYTEEEINEIDSYVEADRDLLLTDLAVDTLIARYLKKDINDNITELPQHMFMSIAMFLAQNEERKLHWVKHFYDVMSKLEYLPATPTLSNGRNINGNCFSCYVGSTSDSITDIFRSFGEQAEISKNGGGIGWDWTRVRALGGQIQSTRNAAGGLVPWMKIENDIAIAVDQLGVRLGAIAVYVESWHKDILDFLELKKNSGEDKRRAKELFLAVSCSDLFMERVVENGNFTLFDPYDVPMLTETHSEAFEKEYKLAELRFNLEPDSFSNKPVTINAKVLWKKIQTLYFETGMPFLFFKDTVNKRHENPELGIIRSSNLCTEFMNPTREDEVSVCNLGSINLSIIHEKPEIDRVVPVAMRMLDNIIDLSGYPVEKARKTQLSRRSVGLGIAGEAEMLANMQIMYGSTEHIQFIDKLYANIAEASDEASIQLGHEKGTWKDESPYRNAYRRCIAPTSSVSIIMGTTACHDAVYNKIWVEENKMGAFKVTAPGINPDNFAYYVPAYDVNQVQAAKATGIRQKHFDMGISHNIYFKPGVTTGKMIFDTLIECWKAGLGTTYYLRSEGLPQDDSIRNMDIACFGCGG